MNQKNIITILLVDDEEDFRLATSQALSKRGFVVIRASSGTQALQLLKTDRPDIVILDLKMPGMTGIDTLYQIRKMESSLPVIILTGHGTMQDAMAGIKLEIVDFIQKPVDIDYLEAKINRFFTQDSRDTLREPTIAELMVSPENYPRLYIDESIETAVSKMKSVFFPSDTGTSQPPKVRSAIVYDRKEKFLGLIRFQDMLKLVLPEYLEHSPHASFFTGMFLAQCKMLSHRTVRDLMQEPISIPSDAPLMEAVHMMVKYNLVTLPILSKGELTGILRERDIIFEIAKNFGNF